jgi:hypothetical protein
MRLACALSLAMICITPRPSFAEEEVKIIEWKASAQAGLVLNTGNADTVSVSASANVSRNDGKNRFSLDVGGAYAKAAFDQAVDKNMDGSYSEDEITRQEKNVAGLWNLKFRYDRFLTRNNILYAAAFAWGNSPAGKNVVAGGQAGYARQLYKSEMHLVMLEVGYDYSYENLVAPVPDLHIHSLRGFFGYNIAVTKDTALGAEIEVLCNMNELDAGGGYIASPFEDTRVNAKILLNTRLWKRLSFRFSFTARYDNVPAPRPPLDLPFTAGFLPRAEKLDTLTDASLIFSFL